MGFERSPDRVLIVHDPHTAGTSAMPLSIPGAEVVEAHSLEGYHAEIAKGDYDVVVIDFDLPGTRDAGVLAELKVRDNEPDVLLMSKCHDEATVREISRSHKRYVLRDEAWVDSVRRGVRDILRIRRLENENSLIRARLTETNRQLEERNSRLDEFCATIAHDIRGPLAGLILKIDYILARHRDGLDDKAAAMLKRSMDSAQRLVGIVQAMYEFARLGREGTAFTDVALAPMAREIIADLREGAACELTLEVSSLPVIRGNRELLRRVLLNLFSNSIKYGDREWVIISVTSPGTETRADEPMLAIHVRDNGPGIPAEIASSLFSMFSRGDRSNAAPDGLGIGLAVAQRILGLHGGAIELVPDGRPGCCFKILLPLS